jgi:RNA polymerase sigma-70 factor (sigma-E family)
VTFEEYVAARGAALVRFARVLTGDNHRSEDLVQDALAKAYPRWGRILRSDQPDVYMRRVIINAARSWWRRKSNREAPVEQFAEQPTDRDSEAEAAERDALWRHIVRLPERQRAVLVLRYYEDLDDLVIAEILGCSTSTVRTHAMRALAVMRQHCEAPGHVLTKGQA